MDWRSWRTSVGDALASGFSPEAVATAWVVARALEAQLGTSGFARIGRALPAGEAGIALSLGDAARAVSDAADPEALYGAVLSALRRLDADARDEAAIAGPAPVDVDVDIDPPARVRVWFRPPSALAALTRALWHAVPRAQRYPPQVAPRLRHLGVARITADDLALWPVAASPSARVGWPVADDHLRVLLCPLGASFPRFVTGFGPDGDEFRARRDAALTDPAGRVAELDALGAWVAEEQARIVVLPELTCPPDLAFPPIFRWFRRAPSLRLVVAGSFHVAVGDGPPANRASVLAPGEVAWSHDKRGHFRIRHEDATRLGPERFFVTDPREAYLEGITWGSALSVFDCDLGRIAVMVCADALEPDRLRAAVLDHARPDLVILPSMSAKTDGFVAFAQEAHTRGIGVLFVNARAIGGDRLAYARFPWPDLPGLPATASWRPGVLAGHTSDGRVVGPGRGFRVREPDGLVVDLAAWWHARP